MVEIKPKVDICDKRIKDIEEDQDDEIFAQDKKLKNLSDKI